MCLNLNTADLTLLTQAQQFVLLLRPDLQKHTAVTAVPDPTGIRGFLFWWLNNGLIEYPAVYDFLSEEQCRLMTAPAFPSTHYSPPISYYLAYFWQSRADLVDAYSISTETGRRQFAMWIVHSGRAEIATPQMWIDQALRDWLLAPDPDISPAPRLAYEIWKTRSDLQTAFNLLSAAGRRGLLDWFKNYGLAEHGLECFAHATSHVIKEPNPIRLHKLGGGPKISKMGNSPVAHGVNLIGFASAEFGLGEDVRMAARALSSTGLPISIFEVPPSPEIRTADRSVDQWISPTLPHSTSIMCMPAFETARFYLRFGSDPWAKRLVIGYWPWELSAWPSSWNNVFRLANEVWASSRHTQFAFTNAASIPVLHMPMAVDLPVYKPRPREQFNLKADIFQFLFIFDWNSWPARKNPTAVIEAFRLAFPAGNEPVGLAIKIIGLGTRETEISRLEALVSSDPRISLILGTLDRAALVALYHCCDAYISLHRAEGFGRTIAEAMLMGKPVVATNWSGNLDFLDKSVGCPVDFVLKPIDAGDYPYSDGQLWAEPDLRSAANHLRWLAADRGRAAALGLRARDRILEQFDFRVVGNRYAERLNQLWQSRLDLQRFSIK